MSEKIINKMIKESYNICNGYSVDEFENFIRKSKVNASHREHEIIYNVSNDNNEKLYFKYTKNVYDKNIFNDKIKLYYYEFDINNLIIKIIPVNYYGQLRSACLFGNDKIVSLGILHNINYILRKCGYRNLTCQELLLILFKTGKLSLDIKIVVDLMNGISDEKCNFLSYNNNIYFPEYEYLYNT